MHDLDICAVLEEAGDVVERGEDHDEDDEVAGANVEPAEGARRFQVHFTCG